MINNNGSISYNITETRTVEGAVAAEQFSATFADNKFDEILIKFLLSLSFFIELEIYAQIPRDNEVERKTFPPRRCVT